MGSRGVKTGAGDGSRRLRLGLLGVFRLSEPDGTRIDIPSRKGVALVALLATAADGVRTRGWLQDKLWGARGPVQGRASLRRELSNLRILFKNRNAELLVCEHDRVSLDLGRLWVDVRDGRADGRSDLIAGEFLEGFDLPGEDSFEDWLREQRDALRPAPVDAGEGAPRKARPQAGRAASEAAGASVAGRTLAPSRPAAGLRRRPSLTVLPMRNLTGDAANNAVAEDLGELLVDRLSRLRWLAVIARATGDAVERPDPDLVRPGAASDAKYMLEGRLRRHADGFSLAVDLSESASGQTLWSNRASVTSFQAKDALERLVGEWVAAVDACVDHAEQSAAWLQPPADLTVSDLIWRGRWHAKRLTREDSGAARTLFAEAMAREPTSSEALVQFAWALVRSLWARRAPDGEIKELRRLAQQVNSIDADDSRGYMLAGAAEFLLRNPPRAKALLNRAISLNPSLANAHAYLGSTYNLNSEPALAIAPIETALRLSPTDYEGFYFLGELAMAHSMLGDWETAIDYADQSLARRGAYWYAHVLKTNALARAGRLIEARGALDDLLAANPRFTEDFIDWLPFFERRWVTYFRAGIGMAREHSAA